MDLAELGDAQRQVAIALEAMAEDRHCTGAVHRLEGEHPLILGGCGEHMIAVVLPMPGGFPQSAIHHVRGIHLDVTGLFLALAHIADQLLEQGPALGVPEHRARCAVVEMEQVQLCAQLAVIALAGFFEAGEVGLEVLGVGPAGTVDPLQRCVVGVAAPVGARHLGQLEGLQQPGRRHMGAATQVFEITLAIQ